MTNIVTTLHLGFSAIVLSGEARVTFRNDEFVVERLCRTTVKTFYWRLVIRTHQPDALDHIARYLNQFGFIEMRSSREERMISHRGAASPATDLPSSAPPVVTCRRRSRR